MPAYMRRKKVKFQLCAASFLTLSDYIVGKLNKKKYILKDMEFKFNMRKVILAFLRVDFFFYFGLP